MDVAHFVQGNHESPSSLGNLFVALADHSPQPMLITNDLVEILYVNPAWEKQFGYVLAEVRGQNPRILKSGKTPPEVHQRMWQTLRSGKTFQTTDVVDKRKDGSFFNLRSTVFPVHAGESLYYVQILDDITDEKRALEFQKLYLKTAAHDMKTPLQSMRLLSDLALIEQDDRNILNIQKELKRVDTMMSTLLDADQFEAGKIILASRVFDISEAARSIARGSHAHPGEVVCDVSASIMVFADQERISQVITNLVENALKYAGGSTPVCVALEEGENRVVVSVRDKGRGIPVAEQAQLFEPNFRTQHARESTVTGSGLGLYIVKEIIRAHGEQLWVDSRPGEGSAFSFTLSRA